MPKTGMPQGDGNRVDIDLAEIYAVVGFYRRTAEVVAAAAADISAHHFGDWAIGAGQSHLAARFSEISSHLSDRLARQAVAAGVLAERLRDGAEALESADYTAAITLGQVTGPVPSRSSL